MEDDNPLNRIRKAAKKKLDEIQESEIIQEITNAIGDRRIRDLVDIIAQVEISDGWNTVVDYLLQSEQSKYPIPIGYDTLEIMIEPIKYREMVFEYFGCIGWEPVNISTSELLKETYNADSNIDALKIITKEIVHLAREHIEKPDTLFFISSDFNHNIPISTTDAMVEAQNREITNLKITKQDDTIFVLPMWYTEHGRRALSNIGINGDIITRNEYDIVLSVLQVSPTIKRSLIPIENIPNNRTNPPDIPINPLYRHLLHYIITHDTNSLGNLGSRHSFSVLNYSMRNAIDQYKSNNDSISYRALLSSIRNHVGVRNPESVILLKEGAIETDPRLATPSIIALGNFYTENAINALIDIICTKNLHDVHKTCFEALENIRQRCPETKRVIKDALSQNCKNVVDLQRYYRKTWNK